MALPAPVTEAAENAAQNAVIPGKSESFLGFIVAEQQRLNPHTEFKIETVKVKIDTPEKQMRLDNNIYILASNFLDLPIFARLQIYSRDNYFRTSKPDFEASLNNSNKVFKGFMNFTVENYGATTADFRPFNLVFAKLTFVRRKKTEPQIIKDIFTNNFRAFKQQ
jgi:hypothetical protein